MLPPNLGECNQQYLTIKGNIWPLGVDRFCGNNIDGQHFYVEIDPSSNGNSQVEFAVVTSNEVVETAPFKWGLWITQIKCDGTTSLESPKGCFQYFLPSSGYLTSFAFDPNGQYLKNQAYRICIMSSKAACRISFEAEDFGLEKFGNYKTSPYTFSGVSSIYCVRDFLRIPDASSTGFLHEASHDRYCGGHFNPKEKNDENQAVIAPLLGSLFTLDVRSGDPNLFPALNSAGIAVNPSFIEAHHVPGFKIKYEQLEGDGCPIADLSFVGK